MPRCAVTVFSFSGYEILYLTRRRIYNEHSKHFDDRVHPYPRVLIASWPSRSGSEHKVGVKVASDSVFRGGEIGIWMPERSVCYARVYPSFDRLPNSSVL